MTADPANSRRRRVPAAPPRLSPRRPGAVEWLRIPAFHPDARVVALEDGGALAWGEDATTRLFVPGQGRAGMLWQPGPALPGAALGGPGIRLGDGSVLIVGGPDGRQVWRWPPGFAAFLPLRPLRVARHGPALIAVGADRALVVGGLAPDGRPAPVIEVVAPDGNAVRGEMLCPRPEPLADVVGDELVIMGADGDREAPEIWPLAAGPGRLGRPAPDARTDAAVLALGGRLLRAGGGSASKATDTHAYDPSADVWHKTGELTAGRLRPRLVRWGANECVLIGGAADHPKAVARVECFDGTGWRRLTTTTVGRIDHDAVALADGRVLVVGGRTVGDMAPPYSELSSPP